MSKDSTANAVVSLINAQIRARSPKEKRKIKKAIKRDAMVLGQYKELFDEPQQRLIQQALQALEIQDPQLRDLFLRGIATRQHGYEITNSTINLLQQDLEITLKTMQEDRTLVDQAEARLQPALGKSKKKKKRK
jgi:ribosomal protein L16 Arg81 hydroxylase